MSALIPLQRGGTAAALDGATENLAADERRIADLRDRRATVLLADDAVAQIAEIDQEIAEAQRAAAVNADRISALKAQLDIERSEDRQRQRGEQVAVVMRLLSGRSDASKALQAALDALGQAIGRMYESREKILKYWPAGLPLPRHDDLRGTLDKEIAWTLFSAGKIPATGALVVPRGLEVLSIRSVADAVADEHKALIDRLRNLPIENEAAA